MSALIRSVLNKFKNSISEVDLDGPQSDEDILNFLSHRHLFQDYPAIYREMIAKKLKNMNYSKIEEFALNVERRSIIQKQMDPDGHCLNSIISKELDLLRAQRV